MFDITTDYYRQVIAKAVSGNGNTLTTASTIAVGTGGVDANGNPLTPASTDTGLYREVLRKNISSAQISYPASNQAQFSITVNPNDLPANTQINEIGVFDNAGKLMTKSTFYSKATDGSTTMVFNVAMNF